jgi:serine/threonine-protein kinase
VKGKIFGSRYKIIEYIAKGGFGKTYLAEDIQLPGKDRCVLKQLYPSIEAPKVVALARRLFKTEASTLHNLGFHEQIPELLAYFEEETKFYLVQQYIEGQTLEKELIREGVWSEARVIEFLKDVLEILKFIHGKGVIHRDIKPNNLIRRHSDGKIVLVDFGTAKEVLQGETDLAQLTVAIGTQGYMPIEQARGKPRAASDLYALGIIAIQALTGVEPLDLEEDEEGELVWNSAEVSPKLVEILNQMTRDHFKDRYQSAEMVLQALNSLNRGLTKPQSITAIQAPLSNDSQPKQPTSITASTYIEPETIVTSTPADTKLQDKIEASPSPTVVSENNISAIQLDPTPEIKSKQRLVISNQAGILIAAIASILAIFSSIYLLVQLPQSDTPTSEPNSTPRVDQGTGFRKDL